MSTMGMAANQSTTILTSMQQPAGPNHMKGKTEDLILANKSVWDKWWNNKIKNSQVMIGHAKNGHYEEVAKAIDWQYNDEQAASVNYQEPATGYTALHYAVKHGHHEIVNLLITNNADLMAQDAKGQTPLHVACI